MKYEDNSDQELDGITDMNWAIFAINQWDVADPHWFLFHLEIQRKVSARCTMGEQTENLDQNSQSYLGHMVRTIRLYPIQQRRHQIPL